MNPKTRHGKLLENVKVRRWYENLEARSTITANVYLRNFGLWLEYLNKDADSIIEFATNDFEEFKGSISDQIRILEKKGTAGASISTSIKPLISYLKFHNVVIHLNLNIKNENRNLNAEKEIIPDKEQLASVLRKAGLRERVSIALMSMSGLRPEVLGNDMGDDGLRISDLPELDFEKLEFTKIPARVNVRAELSKTRLPYFTFIGSEGCKYILDYLKDRVRKGENLNSDSAIILPDANMSRKDIANKFLPTSLLTRRIKAVIIRSGYNYRPYIFRAYFGTNLDSAEAHGLISHAQRQFIMGHKGDIEETYTKRGSELKIDELRENYSKCLKYLETEDHGISKDDSIKLLRQSVIDSVQIFSNIEISNEEKEKLYTLSTDEFNAELKKLSRQSKAMELNNGNRNKIIPENELEIYLNKGWTLIQIYPQGDKAIIKLPD